MDHISDMFNVIDDFNRVSLVIEIDTSLRAARLVRVFERLKKFEDCRTCSGLIMDRSSSAAFRSNGARPMGSLSTISSPVGKPNQNAFIERFNRSLRNELLDLYLFRSLEQVRQLVAEWRSQYNEHRPHDSLGGLPPSVYAIENRKNTSLELST